MFCLNQFIMRGTGCFLNHAERSMTSLRYSGHQTGQEARIETIVCADSIPEAQAVAMMGRMSFCVSQPN